MVGGTEAYDAASGTVFDAWPANGPLVSKSVMLWPAAALLVTVLDVAVVTFSTKYEPATADCPVIPFAVATPSFVDEAAYAWKRSGFERFSSEF